MTDTELAWLAGIIEGEGSFSHHVTREKYHNIDIKVAMTDEDVVRRCLTISGVGRVNGPYINGSHSAWKPQWIWAVSSRAAGVELMSTLYPLMGQRRRTQISACLAVYGAASPEPTMPDRTKGLAWLAGLVEGEGHFAHTRPKRRYHSIAIKVVMADEDVVRHCHEVAGCGHVNGPALPRNPAFKPTWAWTVKTRADVVTLMTDLRPWMGERRQSQIDACLAIHESNPLQSPYQKRRDKTHCPQGHPYSGENLYVLHGNRQCKICMRDRKTRYRARLRLQSPPHL